MLSDLASTKYRLGEARGKLYGRLLDEVLEIFQPGKAASIPLKTRVDAAEALGAAGDPRLRLPGDAEYWVEIKGGSFTMGAQKTDANDRLTYDPEAYNDETPRLVEVPSFHIGRFPVTVREYGKYLEEAGAVQPGDWEEQLLHPSRPVVGVTWHAASQYCQWANKKWKMKVELPLEDQWEFAARGREGRRYPWGSEEPTEERANFGMKVGAPTPVGLFPAGNTPEPEGVADMAGNVLEWTRSKYEEDRMTVRGASFGYGVAWRLRAAYRDRSRPDDGDVLIGFRCVRE
jgi:formylglycine-generating enzyme required for sulfatase activity